MDVPNSKPRPKGKFNLTIGEKCRRKLEHLAKLENRSVSNLVEEMTNERWHRLAETEGFPFVRIISDIADQAKINISNQDEVRRFRRAVLDQLLGGHRPNNIGGGALF